MDKWFNFRLQILIVLCYLALSYLAVIQANYGLIYFQKSKFFSILSIIVSLIGFIIQAKAKEEFVDKGKIEGLYSFENVRIRILNGQKLIWIGLSIYTLNVFFILFMLLISTVLMNYFIRKEGLMMGSNNHKNASKEIILPKLKSIKWGNLQNLHFTRVFNKESPYLLLIVFIYVWIDFFREYSVWHEFEVRLFPKVSLVVAAILAIWGLISSKRSV